MTFLHASIDLEGEKKLVLVLLYLTLLVLHGFRQIVYTAPSNRRRQAIRLTYGNIGAIGTVDRLMKATRSTPHKRRLVL